MYLHQGMGRLIVLHSKVQQESNDRFLTNNKSDYDFVLY